MIWTAWGYNDLSDISIGSGDNQPAPAWGFSFDPTGSHFILEVTYRGVTQTYTSDAGDLLVDGPTKSVIWAVTSAQTSAMVVGGYYRYALRRHDPSGESRIYASGRIDVTLSPVIPAMTQVLVTGPQGVTGQTGPTGSQGPTSSGFGFAAYGDSQYTQSSPQQILAGQTTMIAIDGLAANTDTSHLATPFAGVNFLQNGRFYPRGNYDAYILRLNFSAMSLTINNVIEVRADIGAPIGSIFDERELFGTEAGQVCPFSFPIPIHVKSTFVANGCQFLVTPSSNIAIWGTTLEVIPLSVGS